MVNFRSNYKFTGQELDPETGLYYFNARYYDSAIGRFISPDLVVPDFTNPQSLNRYTYCLNNPLIYIDPSGYWTVGFDISYNVNILGAFFSGGFTVTIDQSGDYALSAHIQGGGGASVSLFPSGITAQLQVTNAYSVDQVSSGTTASVGWSVGKITSEMLIGDNWMGLSLGYTTPSPGEMHGSAGVPMPIATGNIYSGAFLFLDDSKEIAGLELGGVLGSEFGIIIGFDSFD